MRPVGLHPSIALVTICGIILLSAMAFTPTCAYAQRGAAGTHPGGARGGVVRAPQAPVVRAPAAGVSHPTFASPIINRPITPRPTSISPLTPLRMPLTTGMRFPSRPPLRTPITPILGTAGYWGYNPFFSYNPFWGYNPFWLRGCSPFMGFAFGCAIMPPYFGIGYIPPAYPTQPVYPSEPAYATPESSATLQYSPLDQYPSSLPSADLTTSSSMGTPMRTETLLYLKNGSVFAVASYTVSNGQLHYVTPYNEENDLALDLLDLHKTIEANAARGVTFTLTPPPANGASTPALLGPTPAPAGPITPAKQ